MRVVLVLRKLGVTVAGVLLKSVLTMVDGRIVYDAL